MGTIADFLGEDVNTVDFPEMCFIWSIKSSFWHPHKMFSWILICLSCFVPSHHARLSL